MSGEEKRIRKLAEHPTEDDLKVRVERLENRVADLGAFVQAAVKEMRQKEESLLGMLCLKCGAAVAFDFYCEPHLPPKIRAIWEETREEWSHRAAPE